ncbi:hypothetical protein MKW94_001801 [Papaver nudicaule]|uniref:Major facilitator superfamily (MFS) profile domain-containing protein n=1 Tax=Papaver nudicaule TaxID=74823 RepID=A0AA41VBR7_PAPNU|nr:hypothetical protein [Papaver nudicaule]
MAGLDEPLLSTKYIEGVVNFQGEKIKHNSEFGGWKSVIRVIATGSVESFVFYGMLSNLISYLTTQLGQSTATAAMNINAWSGFVNMLPILTSYVADSYLGRFRTILFSSVIYVLGLGSLALYTSLQSASGSNNAESPSTSGVIYFFSSLYLIGIGSAGYKTCATAFGAEQFDELNPNETKSKSSFFNWWLIGLSLGSGSSHLTLNYVQDNLGWGLAFGISCILMVTTLVVFLFGAKSYRYTLNSNAGKDTPSSEEINETTSSIFKALQPLLPLWTICLVFSIVLAQTVTLFTKQGSTMDRSIGPDFQIPAAAIQSLTGLSIILFTALYDCIFVPFARDFTGKSNGITTLQRIGGGLFISTISMVVAAIVENRRLKIALEFGLIDDPKATIPMAAWWLIPQYVLTGLSVVFTGVGLHEFFYDQVPSGLRSVGLSMYSTMFGIGHFLSVFLISVIQKATSVGGQYGWFANNMNQGHLDYFYGFLAGLCIIAFVAFLCFSKSYVYKLSALM